MPGRAVGSGCSHTVTSDAHTRCCQHAVQGRQGHLVHSLLPGLAQGEGAGLSTLWGHLSSDLRPPVIKSHP